MDQLVFKSLHPTIIKSETSPQRSSLRMTFVVHGPAEGENDAAPSGFSHSVGLIMHVKQYVLLTKE